MYYIQKDQNWIRLPQHIKIKIPSIYLTNSSQTWLDDFENHDFKKKSPTRNGTQYNRLPENKLYYNDYMSATTGF